MSDAEALLAPWVASMVASLPRGYRQAIELAELEGLPQRVVAERLGLSLSGAKSRVQRGRAQLRDVVEACCAVELDGRNRVIDLRPQTADCKCS